MKKSHGLFLTQPARHLEPPLGHLEDLVHHEVRALLAEVRDVEDVVARAAQLLGDLGLELGRVGEPLGAEAV